MKKNSNKPVFEKTYFNALEVKHDPVDVFAKSKTVTAVLRGLYDRAERVRYIKLFEYADGRQRIVVRFCKEVGYNPYASNGEFRIHVPVEHDRISITVFGKELSNVAAADVNTDKYVDPTKCRVIFVDNLQKKRQPTIDKIFNLAHTIRANYNAIDDALNSNAVCANQLENLCK
jgi:hypothetical protein